MSYFLRNSAGGALGALGEGCGPGQVLDLLSGGCVQAPTGCGPGFKLDAASGLCVLDGPVAPAPSSGQPAPAGCKPGWRSNGTGGCSVICKPGLVNDASGRYCLDPAGKKPTQPGCPSGSFPLPDGCYGCPPGAQWDGSTGCDCLPGMVYDPSRVACVPGGLVGGGPLPSGSCPPGSKADPFTGAFCVPDPGAAQGSLPVPPAGCPAGTTQGPSGCVASVVPPVPAPASVSGRLLASPLFWLSLALAGAGAVILLGSKEPVLPHTAPLPCQDCSLPGEPHGIRIGWSAAPARDARRR